MKLSLYVFNLNKYITHLKDSLTFSTSRKISWLYYKNKNETIYKNYVVYKF